MFAKVSNAWGVPNQFLLVEKGVGANGNFLKKEVFQSYDSIIAEVIYWPDEVRVTLDEKYWDYSVTTGKYRNKFLIFQSPPKPLWLPSPLSR